MDEKEEDREEKWTVDLQPAAARAPRSYVRVYDGPCDRKVVPSCSPLLYTLIITLAINDMATC